MTTDLSTSDGYFATFSLIGLSKITVAAFLTDCRILLHLETSAKTSTSDGYFATFSLIGLSKITVAAFLTHCRTLLHLETRAKTSTSDGYALPNPISPLPREKSTLFRHGFLCPKIEDIPMLQPGMAFLITLPVSVLEILRFKSAITAPDFLFLNHKKEQKRN